MPATPDAPVADPFELRPFQRELVDGLLEDLAAGKKEVLLAACPGAGKTEMAIALAGELLKRRRARRILVLAHGRHELRENFAERLQARRPDLLESVHVHLPQEGHRLSGKYDVVIVDEAHHFYDTDDGMVSRITKAHGIKQAVLLTGSPSRFIRRGLEGRFFALEDAYANGAAAPVRIEIGVQSAYRVGDQDWNKHGDVKTSVTYTQKQTDRTISEMLLRMDDRLNMRTSPTIVACRNIEMAEQVGRCLGAAGYDHRVSHSEADVDAALVAAFKARRFATLVVVDRAQLGFDMPELQNFVDITGTKNPDRIFQMVCRLVRPWAAPKTFVKVMPASYEIWKLKLFMTGVKRLAARDFFGAYDGTPGVFSRAPLRVPRSPGGLQTGRNVSARLPSSMLLWGDDFQGEDGGVVWTTLGAMLSDGQANARLTHLQIAERTRVASKGHLTYVWDDRDPVPATKDHATFRCSKGHATKKLVQAVNKKGPMGAACSVCQNRSAPVEEKIQQCIEYFRLHRKWPEWSEKTGFLIKTARRRPSFMAQAKRLDPARFAKPLRGKKLTERSPSLAREWDQKRNGQLRPDQVCGASRLEVWWKCPRGHGSYRRSIVARTVKNTGCLKCFNERRRFVNRVPVEYRRPGETRWTRVLGVGEAARLLGMTTAGIYRVLRRSSAVDGEIRVRYPSRH